MKTFLWIAAAAGALAVATTVVLLAEKKPQKPHLALASGYIDAEVIEIVVDEPAIPAAIDDVTIRLLEELAHEGLFAKSVV